MNKNFRTVLLYLVLLAVLVWVVMVQMGRQPTGKPIELTTSEFVKAVKAGRVQDVTYVLRDNALAGKYWASTEAKTGKETPKQFTSTWTGNDSFVTLMSGQSTAVWRVDNRGPSPWYSVLASVLPILLLVIIMFFFLNQMQGGNSKIMNFGKAKAKRMTRDQPRTALEYAARILQGLAAAHREVSVNFEGLSFQDPADQSRFRPRIPGCHRS